MILRVLYLEGFLEEHHTFPGRVVPDVFLASLTRVAPQQVGRYPSIRCGAVPFGIAPYQLVHELRRHRTAFAHYTAFIYIPDLDEITVVIYIMTVVFPGIGNQRCPRMEQRPEFSCQFVRFQHVLTDYIDELIRPFEEPLRIVIHPEQFSGIGREVAGRYRRDVIGLPAV